MIHPQIYFLQFGGGLHDKETWDLIVELPSVTIRYSTKSYLILCLQNEHRDL